MIMIDKKRSSLISGILGPESEPEEADEGDSAIHAISQELIDAVHSKDPAMVASCLKAAHDELNGDEEDYE